ncbi:hypothetical protein GCM10023222_35040 [Saccharopolyspora cebuensis]
MNPSGWAVVVGLVLIVVVVVLATGYYLPSDDTAPAPLANRQPDARRAARHPASDRSAVGALWAISPHQARVHLSRGVLYRAGRAVAGGTGGSGIRASATR